MTGQQTSASNLWSCASLDEGIDEVVGPSLDEEAILMKELQDS
jgi:hypothetical protein